jgi:tetratricopeptide (TPR) repeat protein
MSDPLRTDPANDVPSGERDAKIEQLLLSGLDHYFDGEYDQAINVWTRALFLDRGHARARAYIERARSALAEQQRESEELLQRGLAAFDRGASAEARRLLEAAIMRGAPRDEALSVLDRIHRLDPADAAVLTSDDAPDDRPRRRSPSVARTLQVAAWIVLAASVVVAAFVSAGAIPLDWLWLRTQQPQAAVPQLAPAPADAGPTVPRRGERALNRARVLAQNGHLRDALTNLEQVTITDEEKIDADRLRADIQRQLIALEQASGDNPAPPAAPAGLTP